MIKTDTIEVNSCSAPSAQADVRNRSSQVPERRVELLSLMLRGIGAAIIIAAASVFLLQHWEAGNDIHRYALLLGFSVLLSGAGFFCALRLKESKGARTLLGLTLAVMPVHFAVLGGLLYSRFALDAPWTSLPGYAIWLAPSDSAAILAASGAVAVLLPLGYLSFLSLGRSAARWLTATFFAANLTLLLPVRGPDVMGLLIAVLGVGMLFVELRVFSKIPALKTGEGRFLRILLAVPALLMTGRTIRFYSATELFLAAVLTCLALGLFLYGPRLVSRSRIQAAVQGLSVLPATVAWLLLVDQILNAARLGPAWTLPLVTLPVAGILLLMSLYCQGAGTGYRRGAVFVALAGVGGNLLVSPGIASATICLVTGVGSLAYGYYVEQKLIFFAGVAGVILGLVSHLGHSIRLYSLLNWGSLALIGITVILAASLLERHHGKLVEKVGNLRRRLHKWDY